MLEIKEKHQFKYFTISLLSNSKNSFNDRIGKLIQYRKDEDVFVFRTADNRLRRYENIFVEEVPEQMTSFMDSIFSKCDKDENFTDDIDGKFGFIC